MRRGVYLVMERHHTLHVTGTMMCADVCQVMHGDMCLDMCHWISTNAYRPVLRHVPRPVRRLVLPEQHAQPPKQTSTGT